MQRGVHGLKAAEATLHMRRGPHSAQSGGGSLAHAAGASVVPKWRTPPTPCGRGLGGLRFQGAPTPMRRGASVVRRGRSPHANAAGARWSQSGGGPRAHAAGA